MLKEQLERMISGLKRPGLTEREKQFIESAAHYYNQTGRLTEQQESILEGIYREKTRFPSKVPEVN
jgi:uncharacterized membrane-anchored protein